MKNKAVTLIEIIVAMMILSGVMAGIVGIFVSGKRHISHSRERMSGMELGKLFVEPLQGQVRQDTWDTSANALNVPGGGSATYYCDGVAGHIQNPDCPSSRKLNNIDYVAEYNVDKVLNGGTDTNLRRVTVKVNWSEPSL